MRSRVWALVVAVVAAACSSDDDLPLADAERVRGLAFLAAPRVVHQDRQRFLAAEAASARAISDEDVALARATWGRLGFFGSDFDVRAAFAGQAKLVGAFYTPQTKVITVFEGVEAHVLVHELVHVLQDQHFDLLALAEHARTSDEELAQAALAEGDAELAETRFEIEAKKQDPLAYAPKILDVDAARAFSQRILDYGAAPAFFTARAALAYPFGPIYVARAAGLAGTPAVWDTAGIDAVFRRGGPVSTQEVLHAEHPPDPVEAVGLTDMPAALSPRLRLGDVDRLGEWYVSLLLSPSTTDASTIAAAWDGDQLVTVLAGDDEIPRGIVWSTAWDDAASAARFATALENVQVAEPTSDGPPSYVAGGEPAWIERRGHRVVFARGLATADLRVLADAAFADPADGPRLAIRRGPMVGRATWQ